MIRSPKMWSGLGTLGIPYRSIAVVSCVGMSGGVDYMLMVIGQRFLQTSQIEVP